VVLNVPSTANNLRLRNVCREVDWHLRSPERRAGTFARIWRLIKGAPVRLLDLHSPQGRCSNFTHILFLSRQCRYVYSRLRSPQGSHLPSGYRPFPDAGFTTDRTQSLPSSPIPAQLLFNTHQRAHFNVSQPISMTVVAIAASDVRIMIRSADSLDLLSLLNFSAAHTTHFKSRFRHPRPKSVSSFCLVSCPTMRN
jgi:hypothetical protein